VSKCRTPTRCAKASHPKTQPVPFHRIECRRKITILERQHRQCRSPNIARQASIAPVNASWDVVDRKPNHVRNVAKFRHSPQ
jgi:hypothetical protein